MTNSKKISVISGVLLIVLLFAFVAMLAVAGLIAPTVTANAYEEIGGDEVAINIVEIEKDWLPANDDLVTVEQFLGFKSYTDEEMALWPEDGIGRTMYVIHRAVEGGGYQICWRSTGYRDAWSERLTNNQLRAKIQGGMDYYYTAVEGAQGGVKGGGAGQVAKVAEPIILPEGEEQNGTVPVRIFCETEGATIYYSIDGSIPNEHSTVYVPGSTITVPANATIRAVARKAGMQESVLAVESFNSYDPGGNGGGTIGKGDVAPIVVKEPQKAGHGFCVGWVVFIFVMLELLYLALYFILWFPKAAFLVEKCKLTALNDFKNGHILFGVVDLLAFIGLCVSCGVFLFALIALCCHACAVTAVSFILALLVFAAFVAIFVLDHKDLVKSWIDKIFKKEKKEEEPASEAEETPVEEPASEGEEDPAEEPASTQNDQE